MRAKDASRTRPFGCRLAEAAAHLIDEGLESFLRQRRAPPPVRIPAGGAVTMN